MIVLCRFKHEQIFYKHTERKGQVRSNKKVESYRINPWCFSFMLKCSSDNRFENVPIGMYNEVIGEGREQLLG